MAPVAPNRTYCREGAFLEGREGDTRRNSASIEDIGSPRKLDDLDAACRERLMQLVVPGAGGLEDLETLAGMDFDAHPSAGLTVAVALWGQCVGDARAVPLATQAAQRFRELGDERGSGCAAYVLGRFYLDTGAIAEAAQCWRESVDTLGVVSPVDEEAIALLVVECYRRGDLGYARQVAELAASLGAVRANPVIVRAALGYVAILSVISGDFWRVQSALRELGDEREAIAEAARGAVLGLRGDHVAAREAMDVALQEAGDDATEVVVRAVRAEILAPSAPGTAGDDARRAVELAHRVPGAWLMRWALRAEAIAQRVNGDLAASEKTLRALADASDASPLERGLALLSLGETLHTASRDAEAIQVLDESRSLLASSGARYWQVRALVRLAAIDADRAVDLLTVARTLSDPDPAFSVLLAEQPGSAA